MKNGSKYTTFSYLTTFEGISVNSMFTIEGRKKLYRFIGYVKD